MKSFSVLLKLLWSEKQEEFFIFADGILPCADQCLGAGERFELYKTGGYEPLPYPEFLQHDGKT
jgi:hypothetical protein